MARVAVVTGASGGIGRLITQSLLESEYKVFALVRSKQSYEKLLAQLPQDKQENISAIYSKLMGAIEIERDLDNSNCDLSKVDTLINGIGLANEMANFQDMKLEEIDDVLRVNLNSILFLTRLLLPRILKNTFGHIVNIGSVAGRWSSPSNSVYSVAKSGINSFSESLRMDLMGTSVRVTNIEPGLVNTEFVRRRFASKEKADHFFRGVNMLEPEDVAETVMWSLSRPHRVNIQEIVMFSSDQAGVGYVSRSKN